jgi:hypothetical protein
MRFLVGKVGLMPDGYTYVDGASLGSLVWQVRDEFETRLPYELDETRRPNSLRLTAIDVFEGKSTYEQLQVLRDLMDVNPSLIVTRDSDDIFVHSDTPATYITDLVCEVVRQILVRDPAIRDEDQRRLHLSAESAAELDEY